MLWWHTHIYETSDQYSYFLIRALFGIDLLWLLHNNMDWLKLWIVDEITRNKNLIVLGSGMIKGLEFNNANMITFMVLEV